MRSDHRRRVPAGVVALDLRRDDQCRRGRPARRHDRRDASLPRQFSLHFRDGGRLRAGGEALVQWHRRRCLFHGMGHRARRRLRALARSARGQACRAGAGEFQDRHAGKARRFPAPDRGGREIRPPRPALPRPAMQLRLDGRGQQPGAGRATGQAGPHCRCGARGLGAGVAFVDVDDLLNACARNGPARRGLSRRSPRRRIPPPPVPPFQTAA